EVSRADDRPVNVALRRKVYHAVRVVAVENSADFLGISDIRALEGVAPGAGSLHDIGKALEVARVCQRIQVHNLPLESGGPKEETYEIGADKSCSASDEN